MQIRLATLNDLNNVVACVRSAYGKYTKRIGREPAPMLADYKAQIKQGIVWVLIEDNDIPGVLVAFPEPVCWLHFPRMIITLLKMWLFILIFKGTVTEKA